MGIWGIIIACRNRPVLLIVLLQLTGCLPLRGQRYVDFSAATPLESAQCLVLGFVGGREAWDDPDEGVRQLALKLRSMDLPAVIETVENRKRQLALQLIEAAFDRDRSGSLDPWEKEAVRLILYGQSFGGAAVVKLAHQLQARGIPVILTVQIDSVGRGDGVIPSNVRSAANLYQSDGFLIKGQSTIRAEDPAVTEILGNLQFSYSERQIDLSGVRWYKKAFRVAHTKMGLDPEVWSKVEGLILGAIEAANAGTTPARPDG